MIEIYKKNKKNIKNIIDSLIELLKNKELFIKDNNYFYHHEERKQFIIFLYLFKLTINNKDYLEKKYQILKNKYPKDKFSSDKKTDIKGSDALDIILQIKEKISSNYYNYSSKENKIYFYDNTYIDAKWFLSYLSLLLDNTKNEENKEINICYTIPSKDLQRIKRKKEKEEFLSSFTFYHIKVSHKDLRKPVKENNILILKNAAINYLKHLKQYEHGLEGPDSYKIFYNLLKNETNKEGYELKEKKINLTEIDENLLERIDKVMDKDFYNSELSRQSHLIESCIWQSSNDITLLEQTNSAIDHLIDLLTYLNISKEKKYSEIKEEYKINDIQIILILVIIKFILTYDSKDDIDYSLLNLSHLKPKYMNSIGTIEEQEIKSELRSLEIELSLSKKNMDKFKKERQELDSMDLDKDKYQKELERCVSNINSESIIIGRLNSTISSLSRNYEKIKKEKETKYYNIEKYSYNCSIIRHIYNSIIGCNFYLKTSNSSSIFNNIIIFEDYEKMDNSFYLEATFKDLLKVCANEITGGSVSQNDLPKLAK